jgi:hypothetical protein
VLFCLIDDVYTLLNPRTGSNEVDSRSPLSRGQAPREGHMGAPPGCGHSPNAVSFKWTRYDTRFYPGSRKQTSTKQFFSAVLSGALEEGLAECKVPFD